ncbi:hypothetical protein PENANT_c025G00054 [Penicillium antarcticum]|uniref:Uncharacterized protein n=1 Tax=Penicillium antarcticum TaxID=416450 RepID=A0A1V6PXT9_9EURO|nr:uncharacterized protein N7508_000445 [Penicillium antarcticum]KAJ5320162.1 hypothetical protein N7508_000445 [Penicillium antarcticum]OQD81785.1 hypothetical protein PENANT_c025G00054 [Penicillium antarcticum]
MAPDLSTVNPSGTRPRASTTVPPDMASQSPTPRQPVQGPHTTLHSLQNPGSPPLGTGDYGITSTAQGPLRHPQPLTPSDLHLVLEKEQEAMVNRLTRELSLLRHQTASVSSTASSTSTFNEPDARASPTLSNSGRPHSTRRHRSNSSLSSHASAGQVPQTASVTGIAPSRETSLHSRTARSREPSLTSRRPSIGSLSTFSQSNSSVYPHRNSISQTQLGYSPTTSLSRFEEATQHRSELESIKRENEQLRKRVKDLEQKLKKQKDTVSSVSTSDISVTPSSDEIAE